MHHPLRITHRKAGPPSTAVAATTSFRVVVDPPYDWATDNSFQKGES